MSFKLITLVLLLTAFCFVLSVVPANVPRNVSTRAPSPEMCVIYEQKCFCWIESKWIGSNRKVYDFGSIGRFAAELGGKRQCLKQCRRTVRRIVHLDDQDFKNRLCHSIDRTVRQSEFHWVSRLGEKPYRPPLSGGYRFRLCCHKPTKCPMGNGQYKYDKKHNLCVKKIIEGCIPGVPAGDKTPPVCCLKSSLTGRFTTYGCQPAQNHRARSVDCGGRTTPRPPAKSASWSTTVPRPGH